MNKSVLNILLLLSIFVLMTLVLTSCVAKRLETNTYELNEEFSSILTKTSTADIILLPSDDEKCKVVCYEEANVKHSVLVSEGVLTINEVDTRKWYNHLNINVETPKITIYLPQSEYSSLVIENDTGDIDVPNDFTFESIDISLSTGDVNCCASTTGTARIGASTGDINVTDISVGMLEILTSTGDVTLSKVRCDGNVKINVTTGKTYLSDITCQNVVSSGDTGDISLNNVIAYGTISIERSTGDVELCKLDAQEIDITTSTGNVKGNLLTEKVFITKSSTGKIDVPNSITGGRCEITTDTGDIIISIQNQ